MKMIPASDSSLMVVFGDAMSPETENRILGLFRGLQVRNDPRIRNLHPAYTSLLIDFDPLRMGHEEVRAVVSSLTQGTISPEQVASDIVEIPVCYGEEFGPDLADLARHTGLSSEDVVRLHSGAMYRVCFLGFTAGFAYLGGMPEALCMPRLATPRRAVAAGSVGIAGGQTGIYPAETPGGWRLIGRTPLPMFDPGASSPTRLQAGDRVRFVPIDGVAFERLRQGHAG
jgi:inhibitor of KinA